MCSQMGINQRFSPTFDHRGTGKVERLIRTVRERILATFLSHTRANTPFVASSTIALIQRTLRWTRTRLCHGLSPFHLHFGRPPQTTFSNLPAPVATALPHHWCNILNNCLRLDRKGTPLTCKVDWFNLDVDSSTDDDSAPPPSLPRTKKPTAVKKAPTTKAAPKTTASKQPMVDEEEHIMSDDTGEKFAIRSSSRSFPPPGYPWRKVLPRSKMQARYRPVTAQPTSQSEHTFTFGRHNVVRKNDFALGPSTTWSSVPIKLESSSSTTTRAKPQKPGPVTSDIPANLTNSGPSRNLYDYAARKTVAPRGRGTNRRKAAVPVKNARTPIPPPESPSHPRQNPPAPSSPTPAQRSEPGSPTPTTRPKVLFSIPSSDDSDTPPPTRRSTRIRSAVDIPGGVMISTVQPNDPTSPGSDAIFVRPMMTPTTHSDPTTQTKTFKR